ncbi:MAG: hypothetical protein Q7J21_07985 [Rugosibacter sp.]|nr:hypothetical protein [Rugosibacter sp.]
MPPAPTFFQHLKNEKRGQRRALGEEVSTVIGFFYSLVDAVEKTSSCSHRAENPMKSQDLKKQFFWKAPHGK